MFSSDQQLLQYISKRQQEREVQNCSVLFNMAKPQPRRRTLASANQAIPLLRARAGAGCHVCSCRGGSTMWVVAAGDRVSTPDFSIAVIVRVAVTMVLHAGAGGCDSRQRCDIDRESITKLPCLSYTGHQRVIRFYPIR